MTTKTHGTRIDDVVIDSIERLRNTINGNPRYRFHTNRGTFLMANDASLGYSVENYTNSRFTDTFVIGNPLNPAVTLLTTEHNKVWGIERDGEILR